MNAPPPSRTLALAAAALTTLATTGCYERVTSSRGIGSTHTEVQEPYQRSGPIDDIVTGVEDFIFDDNQQQRPRRSRPQQRRDHE